MRGTLWLDAFIEALKENEDKLDDSTDAKWTESIALVMEEVGAKLHCGVSCKKSNKEESEEYLGIDFMFFYKKDYDKDEKVLPIAIVEHENGYKNIGYPLWKILSVHSTVKVLICYQSNTKNVALLKQQLEDTIWQGNLMKGSDSDLLVIIGDESVKDEEEWEKYYKVYEWRNGKLEKIERM
jgi:hypothetical protein